ncbi:hypothetical protein B0H14DRAFT_3176033 [Mycena olivaceomarginata]|nr:hypothetical protein B0H14DRAFT_3176033 [Mycena olivaceomarginata]
MSSTTDQVLSPIPDFIHVAFNKVLISPDDTVFQAALHTFWSAHVQESDVATSSHLSRAGFGKVVQGLRAQFLERKLIKETFVIATPADPSNKMGAVAATHVFSAVQDGQDVTVTIVAMLRIEWFRSSNMGTGIITEDRDGGRFVTEAFISIEAPKVKYPLTDVCVGQNGLLGGGRSSSP